MVATLYLLFVDEQHSRIIANSIIVNTDHEIESLNRLMKDKLTEIQPPCLSISVLITIVYPGPAPR